jgi:GDP-D-mannose dehydratase
LLADPSKAHRILGWHPHMTFERLVTTMVDADVSALSARAPQRTAA